MGPLDLKQLMKVLYSIDKSLGRIAEALEKQNIQEPIQYFDSTIRCEDNEDE